MYYKALNKESREKLFSWMRKTHIIAQAYDKQARSLEAPQGYIAVGAGAFDQFIRAATSQEYLSVLRRGGTPDEAWKSSKKLACLCVEKHNAKRPKDVNWQRWEGTADAFIDDLHRSLISNMTDESVEPAEPTPTPAA